MGHFNQKNEFWLMVFIYTSIIALMAVVLSVIGFIVMLLLNTFVQPYYPGSEPVSFLRSVWLTFLTIGFGLIIFDLFIFLKGRFAK